MTYAFTVNSIFRWAFVVLHKWKIILRYPSDYGAYRSIIITIRYSTKDKFPTCFRHFPLSGTTKSLFEASLGSLDFLAFQSTSKKEIARLLTLSLTVIVLFFLALSRSSVHLHHGRSNRQCIELSLSLSSFYPSSSTK